MSKCKQCHLDGHHKMSCTDSHPRDPEHIKSFAVELLVTTRAKSADEAEAAIRDRLREVTEFVGVKSVTELVPFTARVELPVSPITISDAT